MILSNFAIHNALDQGRVKIDPEPSPRFPSLAQPDCPYGTTAVDLSLGPRISIPKSGPFTYDLSRPGLAKFLTENSEHLDMTALGSYSLKPHTFILGQTMEHVELPILDGIPPLAARIEGKSSFARCGLLVHFTAPTVHAGWAGKLTLEMINPAGATGDGSDRGSHD